jgi:hypothetical protein
MKPMNSLRWIESKSVKKPTSQTKFHPLPGGEGRGEGEREYKTVHWPGSLEITEPRYLGCYE